MRTELPVEQTEICGCDGGTRLSAGQDALVTVQWFEPHEIDHRRGPRRAPRALAGTREFWAGWSSRCSYEGPYREQVLRSALVLEGADQRAHRGHRGRADDVAAGGDRGRAQLGLPVHLAPRRGARPVRAVLARLHRRGPRLHALGEADHGGSRRRPPDHVRRRAASASSRGRARAASRATGLASGPDRQRRRHPVPARHLRGAPGHGVAVSQERWRDRRRRSGSSARGSWTCVEERWERPDHGIWEIRDDPRHFDALEGHGWVAVDRAIRLARARGLPAELERWTRLRRDMRDADRGGGRRPRHRGVRPVLRRHRAGRREPAHPARPVPAGGRSPGPGDVRADRARADGGRARASATATPTTGFPAARERFVICSFWLVDNLAQAGETERARELFERLAGFANDLGLLAEEVDPRTGEHLGNFPQAFSHVGLIGAAINLAGAEKG